MYNQPETILEQYDLDIKQISKGRGVFICETDRGIKLLAPFRGSKERAAFLRSILQEIKEQGFPAEQILVTKEGEALAEDESGMRYCLKDMVQGSECSTGREEDMEGALDCLAGLHTVLLQCTAEIPEFMRNERNEPAEMYRRRYRELIKVKNYVRTRKSHNEFERKFLEQYAHYIENASEAVAFLEQEKKNGNCHKLCHGDFNQHNALHTADGMRIINFENLCCNEPVVDLANFLRKMMEKNSWDRKLGMRLLEAYDKKRELSAYEWKLVYVLLLFPEKFWKISNHYSNSHKAWVSERNIEKMNHMIAVEPARTDFLENLFSLL